MIPTNFTSARCTKDKDFSLSKMFCITLYRLNITLSFIRYFLLIHINIFQCFIIRSIFYFFLSNHVLPQTHLLFFTEKSAKPALCTPRIAKAILVGVPPLYEQFPIPEQKALPVIVYSIKTMLSCYQFLLITAERFLL